MTNSEKVEKILEIFKNLRKIKKAWRIVKSIVKLENNLKKSENLWKTEAKTYLKVLEYQVKEPGKIL